MNLLLASIYIIILLLLIVWSCEVFTNAIEHLGKYHKLGEGAVGSIFAAIGTALPETIVPLVAILGAYISGGSINTGNDIGLGAILGSPFMLGTLAMFVTGIAIFITTKNGSRSNIAEIDLTFLHRDLKVFLCAYSIAILTSFVKYQLAKYIIGILLLACYVIYAIRTIAKCSGCAYENGACDDLYFSKLLKGKQNIFLIWIQVIAAIVGLIVFSHFFVENIKTVAESLKISPLIISLLLAPIATELPEMSNSVIWINNKKDTLALSNITGAMVFQSCIPMTIGIFLTPWIFTTQAIANIIIVYISVGILFITTSKNHKLTDKKLILSGSLYFVYIAYLIFFILK